jgi:tricarballylate dehydrogenase
MENLRKALKFKNQIGHKKLIRVLNLDDIPIKGLFACGELIGGVFFNGYPGGSGLTSGAVFGRIAGYGSAK